VLGQIATRLGQLGANILEVEHRRLFLDVPAKGAKLDVTVEARDQVHGEEIFQALEAEGYQPVWIDTATTMGRGTGIDPAIDGFRWRSTHPTIQPATANHREGPCARRSCALRWCVSAGFRSPSTCTASARRS